jgi:hypothetical protein
MLSAIMLRSIMLSAIMLSAIMLNAIMMNVIMVSIVAPLGLLVKLPFRESPKRSSMLFSLT